VTREEAMQRAGDYVLGLVDEIGMRRIEREAETDPTLAAAIVTLERQMAALDDTVTPVEPSEAMWVRIAQRLDITEPAAVSAPAQLVRRRPWREIMPWVGIAASVVLAAGIGYLSAALTLRQPEPVMIAVLLSPDQATPGAIIEAFGDDSIRVVPLEDFVVPEGQVLEVWTLPDPDAGPVSLGTLEAAQRRRLAGPNLPPPAPGQLYEITLEPAPRSPIGRPTGPILAVGYAAPPRI
jgi:anti-sigma-K factor RskA